MFIVKLLAWFRSDEFWKQAHKAYLAALYAEEDWQPSFRADEMVAISIQSANCLQID